MLDSIKKIVCNRRSQFFLTESIDQTGYLRGICRPEDRWLDEMRIPLSDPGSNDTVLGSHALFPLFSVC